MNRVSSIAKHKGHTSDVSIQNSGGLSAGCDWFNSLWLPVSLAITITGAATVGGLSDAAGLAIVAQIVLGMSVYGSLWFLAAWPLVNPVQAVVPIFYWWFGVGPTVEAWFRYVTDSRHEAETIITSAMPAVWIVSLGLPLYAYVGSATLDWARKRRLGLRFLLPERNNYHVRTLVILLAFGWLAELAPSVLERFGISGQEQVGYLGGTLTTIWWVGVIAGVAGIVTFAQSAILSELARSGRAISRQFAVLAGAVLVQGIVSALTAGWKGAFVRLALYVMVAYVSKYQRIPWTATLICLFLYLTILEPFVATGRHLVEMMESQTVEERESVFRTMLTEGNVWRLNSWEDVNIASPFRGLYRFAGEIARRATPYSGEWEGFTLWWGLLVLVPREFFPEKPPANIGNFFTQTLGVDLELAEATDFVSNTSVSIPFEIVGNYGWLAGILSFGIIGFAWSLLCAMILSADRLSTHPLVPWIVVFAATLESPVGHFLAGVRGIVIPVLAMFVVSKLVRGKL